jgi:hypothetical protein
MLLFTGVDSFSATAAKFFDSVVVVVVLDFLSFLVATWDGDDWLIGLDDEVDEADDADEEDDDEEDEDEEEEEEEDVTFVNSVSVLDDGLEFEWGRGGGDSSSCVVVLLVDVGVICGVVGVPEVDVVVFDEVEDEEEDFFARLT